jgi:hypothetical protein|tara:strand:+ start:1349 stop:1648 length:300 start_codon:yes stop_codon:yes gene_type:complete
MPYINEKARIELDDSIDNMINSLIHNNKEMSNEEFLSIAGEINYTFSRIITACMKETSYSKIAIVTGVLENVKQEFYRRIGEPYEVSKIYENGDIEEYS